MKITLPPDGQHGKQPLVVEHEQDSIQSLGYARNAMAWFDWNNDRLQIVIEEGGASDEPAIHVRYNPDGSIAEILVRDDLMESVTKESDPNISRWQSDRDRRQFCLRRKSDGLWVGRVGGHDENPLHAVALDASEVPEWLATHGASIYEAVPANDIIIHKGKGAA